MQAAQNKNNDKKRAVLFVDDDKIVLEVGSLMLQKLGYTVLAVSNGNRAVEILKENKVSFVILDMLMPGMNGFEIYHQLKMIQPNVKIILPSGYTGDQSEERSESIGFDGFIQKPFNLKQLSEKIENIWVN
ncbi:MAG: response regulator [Desulfobacterales bacterium]|jgi:two-component system cell cycle sensor histidine kinase/response regulator CckA